MERRFSSLVRAASEREPVESGWRPIDPELDSFEANDDRDTEWPDDLTTLYWWRPTYWRAAR